MIYSEILFRESYIVSSRWRIFWVGIVINDWKECGVDLWKVKVTRFVFVEERD